MKILNAGSKAVLVHALTAIDNGVAGHVAMPRVTLLRYKMNRATAAVWMLNGWIGLNSLYFTEDAALTSPWGLSIIAHEVCHLRQGWFRAFSVLGELEAWQVGFAVQYRLVGEPIPEKLNPLMTLPCTMDRDVLEKARAFMVEYAGSEYRIDLYPLYPFPQEVKYQAGRFWNWVRMHVTKMRSM